LWRECSSLNRWPCRWDNRKLPRSCVIWRSVLFLSCSVFTFSRLNQVEKVSLFRVCSKLGIGFLSWYDVVWSAIMTSIKCQFIEEANDSGVYSILFDQHSLHVSSEWHLVNDREPVKN
jgi:hypothetical protein